MKLIDKEDLARAREMDLLTYLTYHDPGNLKHVSGSIYSTVEHDSLIINNGKWCWFSQGIGGKPNNKKKTTKKSTSKKTSKKTTKKRK